MRLIYSPPASRSNRDSRAEPLTLDATRHDEASGCTLVKLSGDSAHAGEPLGPQVIQGGPQVRRTVLRVRPPCSHSLLVAHLVACSGGSFLDIREATRDPSHPTSRLRGPANRNYRFGLGISQFDPAVLKNQNLL
jgi:hypothetical protein